MIQIGDNVTNMYRSSGLNGGRKGRILPFGRLFDKVPRFKEAMSGINVGWISKEFLYDGHFISHYKNMKSFGSAVENLLLNIEDFLNNEIPICSNYSLEDLKNAEEMIKITSTINKEMIKAKNGLKEYYWKIKENIIEETISSIIDLLSRRERSTFCIDTNISELKLSEKEIKRLLPYLNKDIFIDKDGFMLLRKYLCFDNNKEAKFKEY